MALEAGSVLGTFEISERIGAGGMGEVYRAVDPALDREVAIKVLPESFLSDPDRLARLEQEAKTLAALNHLNIAQIYGLERTPDFTALVMELVDGPTLEERIAAGPIGVDEALDIAMQVADALEAAHERQIVHRDLKPANIKLRPDGVVKILDFGVAKSVDATSVNSGSSGSGKGSLTQAGVILGTAGYMSPEQARGKPFDQRADIWAFGCLLFEMLSGQPAFGGEDGAQTAARVLEREPDFESMPDHVPPAVVQVIRLTLIKDPKMRVRHIGDVKLMLSGTVKLATPAAVALSATGRRGTSLAPAALGLVLGIVIASAVAFALRPPPDDAVWRYEIELPDRPTGDPPKVAISADGSVIGADVGYAPNVVSAWLKMRNSTEGRFIRGYSGFGSNPIIDPFGEQVAFYVESGATVSLRAISVTGGAIRVIAEVPGEGATWLWEGSWNRSGEILFTGNDGAIYRVPESGNMLPVPMTQPGPGERHRFPEWLPDDERFLYVAEPANTVHVFMPDDDDLALPLSGVTSGVRCAPAGYLVYARDESLWAQRIDADSLAFSGEPQEIARDIVDGEFDISDKDLVYQSQAALKQIVQVDRQGNRLGEVGAPDEYWQITLSPDQRRVALESRPNIYIYDLTSDVRSQLNPPGRPEQIWMADPIWINDSEITVSLRLDGAKSNIYRQSPGGDESTAVLAPGTTNRWIEAVHAGRLIWLEGPQADGGTRVVSFDPDSPDAMPETLLTVPYGLDEAGLSPDGRWLSYASNQTGTYEVYLRPIGDDGRPGDARPVSSNGGGQPKWNGDGSELVYLGDDGFLYAVAVGSDAASVGAAQPLFATGITPSPVVDQFAMTADGGRFLILRNDRPDKLTVVVNWVAELQR